MELEKIGESIQGVKGMGDRWGNKIFGEGYRYDNLKEKYNKKKMKINYKHNNI